MDTLSPLPGTPAAFARVIDDAITSTGLSNLEAAERTGIPTETLRRKRTGLGKPFDGEEQRRLAALLGTTVSALWAQAEGVSV